MKDPVCGMNVDQDSAKGHVVHEGHEYLFCSEKCLHKFQAEPESFIGIGLFIQGWRQVYRACKEDRLVTDGLYAYVRNRPVHRLVHCTVRRGRGALANAVLGRAVPGDRARLRLVGVS